jgi:hypothetical protein
MPVSGQDWEEDGVKRNSIVGKISRFLENDHPKAHSISDIMVEFKEKNSDFPDREHIAVRVELLLNSGDIEARYLEDEDRFYYRSVED